MIEKSGRPGDKVIFDNDPAKLVARILKMVEEDKQKIRTEAPQVK